MDFGDILAQWETSEKKKSKESSSGKRQDGGAWRDKKLTPDSHTKTKTEVLEQEMQEANSQKMNPQEVWMQQHPVMDKDAQIEDLEKKSKLANSTYLRHLPPEDSIDLHGLTGEKAWSRLNSFIDVSKKRGLQKVLIIHGKGNHSSSEPVLSQVVQTFIEQDTRLGAHGFSENCDGGKGSTWVIIR